VFVYEARVSGWIPLSRQFGMLIIAPRPGAVAAHENAAGILPVDQGALIVSVSLLTMANALADLAADDCGMVSGAAVNVTPVVTSARCRWRCHRPSGKGRRAV
jgi:hypothetical protein